MYPNNPHAYYPPGGSLHLIANLEGCQIRFWFTRTGNGGVSNQCCRFLTTNTSSQLAFEY